MSLLSVTLFQGKISVNFIAATESDTSISPCSLRSFWMGVHHQSSSPSLVRSARARIFVKYKPDLDTLLCQACHAPPLPCSWNPDPIVWPQDPQGQSHQVLRPLGPRSLVTRASCLASTGPPTLAFCSVYLNSHPS